MPFTLDSSEPDASEVINATGNSGVVLVCDHASNRIPLHLHNLGITSQEANSHIAWDPGALRVALQLSQRLDAPLIYSNYSRLVVDCNRVPERTDFIPPCSDGIRIPGNQNVSLTERVERRELLFDPYHRAIDNLLMARIVPTTMLLSIHSFTPILQGFKRPWPIGVCYSDDTLWVKRWLLALQDQLIDPVGVNQPYDIEYGLDYTIPTHAQKHGIPAIMLEIRQDEISNLAGIDYWGRIIENAWQRCRASLVR